jgi:hypothetical protein
MDRVGGTLGDEVGQFDFFKFLVLFLIENLSGEGLVFGLTIAGVSAVGEFLPLLGIVRFHPAWNLEETGVVISAENATFTAPVKFCN